MNSELLQMLWIFFPAMIANATALFSRFVPKNKYLDMPVDFGRSWKGKRILGDGKTFKGFFIGTFCAIVIAYIQIRVMPFTSVSAQIYGPYQDYNPFIWGFLTGFGSLFGDSVESFFKRRVGIERGESWFPFDQIDYALGAILFTLFYVQFSFFFYLKLILVLAFSTAFARFVWSIIGMDKISLRK